MYSTNYILTYLHIMFIIKSNSESHYATNILKFRKNYFNWLLFLFYNKFRQHLKIKCEVINKKKTRVFVVVCVFVLLIYVKL